MLDSNAPDHPLNAWIEDLAAKGARPLEQWPDADIAPSDLGFEVREGRVLWPPAIDLIDAAVLTEAFPELHTSVRHVIGSTNTHLQRLNTAAHSLCIAEYQAGGRGRRGRTWVSPYARNLAVSLGLPTTKPLQELGGLSLVVGLALVAALRTFGVAPGLKWPNDV